MSLRNNAAFDRWKSIQQFLSLLILGLSGRVGDCPKPPLEGNLSWRTQICLRGLSAAGAIRGLHLPLYLTWRIPPPSQEKSQFFSLKKSDHYQPRFFPTMLELASKLEKESNQIQLNISNLKQKITYSFRPHNQLTTQTPVASVMHSTILKNLIKRYSVGLHEASHLP